MKRADIFPLVSQTAREKFPLWRELFCFECRELLGNYYINPFVA